MGHKIHQDEYIVCGNGTKLHVNYACSGLYPDCFSKCKHCKAGAFQCRSTTHNKCIERYRVCDGILGICLVYISFMKHTSIFSYIIPISDPQMWYKLKNYMNQTVSMETMRTTVQIPQPTVIVNFVVVMVCLKLIIYENHSQATPIVQMDATNSIALRVRKIFKQDLLR